MSKSSPKTFTNMDRNIPSSVRKRRIRNRLAGFALFIIAVVAIVWVFPRLFEESISSEHLDIAIIDRGSIEMSVSASGKLSPLIEEIVVSPIDSRIMEAYKYPGDTVKKGEALLKLELTSAETQYQQMLDKKEMKKSELIQADISLDNTIRELQMQRLITEKQVRQPKTDLEGERYLDSIGAGTPDKVRKAELNYEEARLQLQQLDQKILNEQKNADAEMRIRELELSVLEKELAEQSRLLNDARILSPRDAVLTFINRQIGAKVAQGTQLAVVSVPDRYKAEGELAGSYRDRLSIGVKAIIKIKDTEIPGTVTTVDPSVTDGVVRFTVIPDETDRPELKSGLSVDIHIRYGFRSDVLRLPNRNFFKYGKGVYTLWVIQDGKAVERHVSCGESSFEYVEVVDGLHEGDRVILSDMERFTGKGTVRIRQKR